MLVNDLSKGFSPMYWASLRQGLPTSLPRQGRTEAH